MASVELVKAVAVTAELCGRTFTENAAAVFCSDLEGYPQQAVLRALTRCRKEVRGTLTTADVIARIDDGRPGPEEAWGLIPTDEGATIVWTEEMAQAYGACAPLLATGDRVGARMTFKEVYLKAITKARDEGVLPKWSASLGNDLEQRKRALEAAVQDGRMLQVEARALCPALPPPAEELKRLPPLNEKAKQGAREQLRSLAEQMRGEQAIPDPRKWAKELRTKDKGGLRVTEAQRLAWKRALDRSSPEMPTGFSPIAEEFLPPGMRKGAKK